MRSQSDDAEFWSRVEVQDVRDCWRWMGTQQGPYGTFHISSTGEQTAAHRYAWSFIYGPVPVGLNVLHSCDRTWCVNPRHLRVGTHEDNSLDRGAVTRVRFVLAEAQRQDEEQERQAARLQAVAASMALDDREVPPSLGAALRRLRTSAGLTQRQFAAMLGVTAPAVCGWENGTHGMTVARMASIARALNIEIAELFA